MSALHHGLSDRRDQSATQIRCAALYFVSDDRAQRGDPARTAPIDWRPHFWLRRLSRRLSVEPVREDFKRNRIRSKIDHEHGAARLFRAERRRISKSLSQFADQTNQAARIFAKRLSRPGKCGR